MTYAASNMFEDLVDDDEEVRPTKKLKLESGEAVKIKSQQALKHTKCSDVVNAPSDLKPKTLSGQGRRQRRQQACPVIVNNAINLAVGNTSDVVPLNKQNTLDKNKDYYEIVQIQETLNQKFATKHIRKDDFKDMPLP